MNLNNKVIFCEMCFESSLRPNSSFNKENVCIACLFSNKDENPNYKYKLEYFNKLIKKKKNKSKKYNYDCIVGVSGGKDSTRQAHWIKNRLLLNPLLVCSAYPPTQMTHTGASNLSNLISMGFDVICLTPAPKSSAILALESFIKFGNVCKSTEMALFSSVPRIAIEFDINTIFWGENPALQVGDSATLGIDEFDGSNLSKLNTLTEGGYNWMKKAIKDQYKINHYLYPEKYVFDSKNISIFYLGPLWEDFNTYNNSFYASLQGLTLRPNEEMETGDLSNASMLDEEFTNINYMIRYYKYGIGRAADYFSQEIREKRFTKYDASKLVEQYDGVCSEIIINRFCEYVSINVEYFWEVVNKYTNHNLFKIKKGSRPIKNFISGYGVI